MLSFKLGFRPPEWVAITVLMFIPGLVSLAFRLAGKEGFGDVGWSLGKMPYWGWAFFGPLGLAVLSFFAAGLSGKATLALRLSEQPMIYALFFKLPWLFPDSSPVSLLCQRFFSVALIGMVPGFILAFGEELGWRGYLLTRLVQTGWPFPLLLSGVIWGVWHFPLIVLTGYAHGAVTLSLIMFTFLTASFGVFIGWLRLASGSVLVAAMAHASFNGFVQDFFGASFAADQAWFWIGDYGVFILVPYVLLVTWLYLSSRVHRVTSACAMPMKTPAPFDSLNRPAS
jgi:membrane protease YdiL (CAAX protease family)